MPLNYPAPPGTVTGWEEITRAERLRVRQALNLLKATGNYSGYRLARLRKKMNKPQTSPQLNMPGLRLWWHIVPDQEMVAFFTLRAWNMAITHTPAYALSVGVTRNDFNVFGALLPLCQWMIGQDPEKLEILIEHETPQNPILKDAIDAIPPGMILGEDEISPGPPWPDMHRWRLQPNVRT